MSKHQLIDRAIAIAGSQSQLATLTGFSQQHISRMLLRKQVVSADAAVRIEAATSGIIKRGSLRPDYWPEPGGSELKQQRKAG